MKKPLMLLMVLALLCTSALAEMEASSVHSDEPDAAVEQTVPVGEFVLLSEQAPTMAETPAQGTFYAGKVDLDGDGIEEEVSYTYTYNDQDYVYAYELAVNGLTVAREEIPYLTGELGAARFEDLDGVFLFVADNGYSDDPVSYVYHYASDEVKTSFEYVGSVDAFPRHMTVTGRNTFTTYVRAKTLYTWYRPADFVIATGIHWMEDIGETRTAYGLSEVPRDLYPVGALVELKVALPLMTSRTDETICRTLQPGETGVIAATDDQEWYYIAAPAEDYETPAGGWFRLAKDSFSEVLVGDAGMDGWDVFDGLLYAD